MADTFSVTRPIFWTRLPRGYIPTHNIPSRNAKPSEDGSPCQSSRLHQLARLHGPPTFSLHPRPSLSADPRKTLGRITAAATAEVRAKDDALCITVSAATEQATAGKRASTAAARRVVVATAHVNINKHYQTADGGVHQLSPGCGPFIPLRGRQRRSAGLGASRWPMTC